jgi:hypothetical protein
MPPSSGSKNKPVKKPGCYFSALRMEAICSSETSVDFQRTTRHYIPEDSTLQDMATFRGHVFLVPYIYDAFSIAV